MTEQTTVSVEDLLLLDGEEGSLLVAEDEMDGFPMYTIAFQSDETGVIYHMLSVVHKGEVH